MPEFDIDNSFLKKTVVGFGLQSQGYKPASNRLPLNSIRSRVILLVCLRHCAGALNTASRKREYIFEIRMYLGGIGTRRRDLILHSNCVLYYDSRFFSFAYYKYVVVGFGLQSQGYKPASTPTTDRACSILCRDVSSRPFHRAVVKPRYSK